MRRSLRVAKLLNPHAGRREDFFYRGGDRKLAISKQRKEDLVAQYAELLDSSKAVFLTEYTGLDVKQMQQLRGEVRKAEGIFRVTKNTLLLHALEEAGKPAPADLLVGQLASGFALNEAPTLAKALTDFAKEVEEFTVKFGILEDELLTAEQVKALASLPSLDELRAQIIGLIGAPAQNITSTVANGVRQVINVVDAYAQQADETETVTE
jgi:large subunit ribosomal protein L10